MKYDLLPANPQYIVDSCRTNLQCAVSQHPDLETSVAKKETNLAVLTKNVVEDVVYTRKTITATYLFTKAKYAQKIKHVLRRIRKQRRNTAKETQNVVDLHKYC